ncbi:MAG: glycosyltransferase family 9 protein [Fimbriimonadaceae bacterium]|nr:glycosyltransferase family 9 protein [Fimbriimonadaceae bacterium]
MKRFLIARLSALGDVACTLPAANYLKSVFPDCEITWAVDPRFAAVPRACRAVDHVITVKPSLTKWPRIEAPPEGFDAAFDLQGLLKSALCVGRARAKVKLGYHWQREGAMLFSARVMPDPSSHHIVDQYVDVVRAYAATLDLSEEPPTAFGLVPAEADILSVRQKLKAIGVSGRFAVMNGGAGWVSKRWPTGHFGALIRGVRELGLSTVLLGGPSPDDRAVADEIRTRAGDCFSLVGETSVGELIALIRLSSVHVGGDTGSTHLAAAMEIPAVGLYSITRPQRSCPYGQIDRCLYAPTGLADITPEAVLAQVARAVTPSRDDIPAH